MALTEHIKNAWNAYKKNFWTIIGAHLIAAAIILGMMLLVAGGLALSAMPFVDAEGNISEEYAPQIMASPYFILSGLVFIITVFVALALRAGLIGVYRDALGKKKAKIDTMFSVAKEKYKTVIGAQLFAVLVLLVGAAVLFIPTIAVLAGNIALLDTVLTIEVIIFLLFALLFSLINQAVVVSGERAIDAVKKSYAIVRGNYIQFLALVLVFFAADLIIGYIPKVWILISLLLVQPLSALAYTSFYIERAKTTGKKKKR
ncbi:MAG: hypothetical protein KAT83_02180 [Candidatus Aenigmarchaeota archaeon]|nr:hypothetical protein [Candidatus Aenigmarchaeota archaeon]